MSGAYRVVDLANWKRAVHCQVFRNSIEPCYGVTFELDVTHFLSQVRAHKYSFTLALVYFVAECANTIEEFRYRFLDGQVVLYDRIDTAFTYLDQDTELFKVVQVALSDSLEEYLAVAAQQAAAQKEYFTGPLANDVFQFSPLPWVSFTHVSHTISGQKDRATPIFDWGKYFQRDGKWLLPFSVQVHHSFVDGIHIGRLADALQDRLDRF